jgi:uncharacterized protein (DUF1810 family)
MEFDHFVAAQEGVYEDVLRELADGEKTSHWMWFIFPQMRGLGSSGMSNRFAINSLDEARRYLQHKVLGARLRECTQLVLQVQDRTAEEIFGYVDCLKFRSSMTLFSLASPPGSVFEKAIEKYCSGQKDPKTLALLGLNDASPGDAGMKGQ